MFTAAGTEPCIVAALVEFGLERPLDVLDGLVPLPEISGVANGLPEVALGMDVCYRTVLECGGNATEDLTGLPDRAFCT